jgi:hypothetical protein
LGKYNYKAEQQILLRVVSAELADHVVVESVFRNFYRTVDFVSGYFPGWMTLSRRTKQSKPQVGFGHL